LLLKNKLIHKSYEFVIIYKGPGRIFSGVWVAIRPTWSLYRRCGIIIFYFIESTMTPDDFQKIIQNGILFNPAHTHYAKECNVMCDKCRKTNLTTCYGIPNYNYDICTTCYAAGIDYDLSQQHDTDYNKLVQSGGTRRAMNIRSYRRASRSRPRSKK